MEAFERDVAFDLKRDYFNSGATKAVEFRRKSLKALRESIHRNESEILEALRKDMGKPGVEAYFSEVSFIYKEIDHTLKNLSKWLKPKKLVPSFILFPSSAKILTEPLGVVLIIGPWNYPFHLMMAPLIPAVAAGNCIVLKPSEETPFTTAVVEKIIKEVYPPEYISVVQGEGATVVPALLDKYRFDYLFFTGSIPIGRLIAEMAARKLTPVTLELGGKSPVIVDETANLPVAAKRIVWGKFFNAGQTCVSPDYLIVKNSIRENLLAELKAVISEFYGDSPLKSESYGKIVNKKRFKKLQEYLKQGKVLFGGDTDEERLVISPTIMGDVSFDSPVMQEEIFGPVLPVIEYQSFEDVIKIIRKNSHPLALYIFSNNREFQNRIIENLQFGGGCINNTIVHLAEPDLPFGGVGNSGYGSYHGKAGFDIFSHKKSVLKTGTWFDSNLKYPPYSNKRLKFFKKILG